MSLSHDIKTIDVSHSSLEANTREYEAEFLNTVFDDLFPLLRSITGPGIEQSLNYFKKFMPLNMEKVPSGSQVFDWTVPKEWHCKSARLIGPDGSVVVDIKNNNLHVLNYSIAYHGTMTLDELKPHLYSLPELPDAIPYVTSYYNPKWGFCLSEKQRMQLPNGNYRVDIDSEFKKGGVPFSHCLLKGNSEKEILLTSYLCHPSMANNELSGPLVLLGLYQRIKMWPQRRYSYRFLLNPETIGSLCFLSRYAPYLKEKLLSGMILTCLGGEESLVRVKHSRMNDGLLDRCVRDLEKQNKIRSVEFCPLGGSDERQYCAPGFNLPMIQVAKTAYGAFDGYHNSLDTKEFMSISSVQDSIDQIENILLKAEYCGYPINMSPFGEPQLGKRNLYPTLNSAHTYGYSGDDMFDSRELLNYVLTILNYSDGQHDLFTIAEKLGCDVEALYPAIDRLEQEGLIKYGVEPITL